MDDADTAVARALAYVSLCGVWRANHCSGNGFEDFIKERLPEQVRYFDCDAEDFFQALKESGYAVVPVEPTEAMQFAGGEYTSGSAFVYKAMLDAAMGEKK